jgi:hypothetical protein
MELIRARGGRMALGAGWELNQMSRGMVSIKRLTLAVALAADGTIVLASGATARYGACYSGLYAGYGDRCANAYASYAPGYYGGYYGSHYYERGRYSGPYRTDSCPLMGGGY